MLSGDVTIQLHHRDQGFFAPLDEVTTPFHRSILTDPEFHPLTGDPGYISWRGEVGLYGGKMQTLGTIFNAIRRKYWGARF